ncbi:MAG: serine/threonine-protein kinase [Pirellula sp.]
MPSSTQSRSGEYRRLWARGKAPSLSQLVEFGQGMSPSKLSDLLLLDQSLRWETNERVSVEQYFELFPEFAQHRESAIDLVYSEFLLRERLGLAHDIDEYLRRFPRFAEELKCQDAFHRMIDAGLEHDEQPSQSMESLEPVSDRASNTPFPDVPGYEILSELGRGGNGVVYKARHIQLNRFVALKMLLAGHFASPNLLRRFLVEAEATARLQHPNIVQIYEVGQIEGRPFLALEFVNGGTLSQSVNGRPLPPREAVSIVKQLARAVHFAHEQGVVHRDLKPGNVLIQKLSSLHGSDSEHDSQLKIADFGLAKLIAEPIERRSEAATMSGDVLGTATYMSPEQARGDLLTLTPSTDIYSLGAILYELLTGRPPFVGVQPIEVLGQVLNDEPMRPSQLVRRLPRDVQTICLKCLEKNPSRRYESAEALADDLTRFMDDQPIVARQISWVERGWRWCRRHPAKTSIAASIAAFLFLVTIVSTLYSIQLGDQLRRTSNAERLERISKMEALNQLWEAKLAQGDAIRMSNQTGQRYDALNAIEEALAMGDSIRFSSDQIDKMRDATIACLALPDIRHDSSWKGHDLSSIHLLDFDQRHSILAYKEPDFVYICRTSSGEEVARIPTQANNLKAIFSNDGRKLALMNNDCRVYAIDKEVARLLYETTARDVWGFTPDGSKILGTDGDGQLVLVNLDHNDDVKRFGSFSAKNEIAISPDSKRAALYDGKIVRVVQLDTGQVQLQIDRPDLPSKRLFAWYPNSQFLAIGSISPNGIELWNVDEQVRWKTIPIHLAEMQLHFSSTGERLLVYDVWSGRVSVWNVNLCGTEFSKSGLWALHMAAEDDGGFRILNWQKDGQLASLRVEVPRVYHTLPDPSSSSLLLTNDIAYSPDGRLLAVSSQHGDVLVYDAMNHSLLNGWFSGGTFVQFDGNRALLTSNKLGLLRWEIVPDEKADGTFKMGPPTYLANSVAYAPFQINKDRVVAISTRKGIELHSIADQRPMQLIGPTNDVRRLSFSLDGKRLATGEWSSGEFGIWDVESGMLVRRIQESQYCFVEYSPNGKWIASNTDHVRIRDAETGELITELPSNGMSVSGVSMAFSPDSKMIAISDSGGKIRFFEPSSGRKLFVLANPNDEQISRIVFNPNGTQLAVISDSQSVNLWNLDALSEELHSRQLEFANDHNNAKDDVDLELKQRVPKRPAQDSNSRMKSLQIQLDQRFLEIDAANQASVLRDSIEKLDIHSARIAIFKILKLQPRKSSTCNALAWTLATGPRTLRDSATAVEFARHAVNDETLQANRRSLCLNTLGVALYRDRQFKEAIEVLTQSLAGQAEQDRPFDLYFLSMCSSRLGENEKAYEFFEEAESLSDRHRSQMPQTWKDEIAQFTDEAKLLLQNYPRE